MFWLYHDGEWVVQWSNTNAYTHTYSIPHTCAKGNSETAADAVSSADVAVVKRLKELKSDQELARQLTSSLLYGGSYATRKEWRGDLCEPALPGGVGKRSFGVAELRPPFLLGARHFLSGFSASGEAKQIEDELYAPSTG
jgi:hypothetical protein